MDLSEPSCPISPAIPSSYKRGDGPHNQEGEHGADGEGDHSTIQSGESESAALLRKHPRGQGTMWPEECWPNWPFTLQTI